MKLISLLLSQLLLGLFVISCKSNTSQPVPALGNSTAGLSQSNDSTKMNEIISKNRSDLERLQADLTANKTDSTGLQKKIDDLIAQMNSNKQLSEEQRKALDAQIAELKKEKEKADAKLKEITDKQTAMEKQVAAASKGTAVASGFPLCGAIYYGDIFGCNGKQCGKSDPAFQFICEITATSRPASAPAQSTIGSSGRPLCGAVYYGEIFNCSGKQCGKSDPSFQNICEITATSKPATSAPAQSTIGSSGQPLCGAIYYGAIFACNGKQCGKSDPAFRNICEITATSRPATPAAQTVGVSGYPFCGATRYGTVFTCNGKQCAKSDPEFKNICEIR